MLPQLETAVRIALAAHTTGGGVAGLDLDQLRAPEQNVAARRTPPTTTATQQPRRHQRGLVPSIKAPRRFYMTEQKLSQSLSLWKCTAQAQRLSSSPQAHPPPASLSLRSRHFFVGWKRKI